MLIELFYLFIGRNKNNLRTVSLFPPLNSKHFRTVSLFPPLNSKYLGTVLFLELEEIKTNSKQS